uniref:Multidrug and toxin extrusion protein n=1 Tax=Schmidtea mediterranea TaxID=79327 RepID=A0A0H3YJN2_SCHMD|nr:slc47a-2 [Schmidtea mediterranea]
MTLLYLVLVCFHLNIEPFLILLKQNPSVAELSTRYITYYIPGLFFDFQFLTISRYLQNQNIVYPMVISSFLGNVFSAVSQYVAIYVYGYKLEASAILQGVSCFVMFILQLAYILISKVYKDTWNGFSLKDALDNWKILFVLGIPGILMIALEEWNFEIATIISGTLDGIQLGAQSIAFQCSTVSFMMTMGLAIATSIRVGQFLGSREIDNLKTAYRTSFVVGMVCSAISCTLILVLRNYIAAMFSSNKEIQAEGSELLFFIAFMQFADMIAGITSGILKACGRQVIGAAIMFACYYLIGIPIGIIFVFVIKLQIKGMWIGLIIALVIEGFVFSVLVFRTNWEVECDKAMANIEDVEFTKSFYDESAEKSQGAFTKYFNEDMTENCPLIVKSDYEGDAYWVREKIHNPEKKIKNFKRPRITSEVHIMPTNRSRSLMIYTKEIYNIDTDQPLRKTIIKRAVTFLVVLLLVICAILIRIYLPKSLYVSCIPDSEEARRNNIKNLCQNSTLISNL